MGAAASVSMGNKTEANVTNSTSNEQYFDMKNIVKITNTMNQKTTSVNSLMNKIGTENINKATIKIKNSTWKIEGDNNKISFSASAGIKQNIEAIATAQAIVEQSSNLKDAVMFNIANDGFSMQSSDMSSAATSSSTTELDVSGIGCAAASVGINNSVCTNINNSIRNVFSMAVTNNMSSATERNALAESINSAKTLVNQVLHNEVGLDVEGLTIDIKGNSNMIDVEAKAAQESNVVAGSSVTSNLKSSLIAETSNIASATSTVEASQTAKSSATASASQTQSTKLSTDGILWVIAIVAIVGTLGTGAFGASKCKKK